MHKLNYAIIEEKTSTAAIYGAFQEYIYLFIWANYRVPPRPSPHEVGSNSPPVTGLATVIVPTSNFKRK